MSENITFNYSVPYDIMVGAWAGHAITYDEKGKYVSMAPSILNISWEEYGSKLIYSQKILDDLGAVFKHPSMKTAVHLVSDYTFNLEVDGKTVYYEDKGSDFFVEGVESQPGIYLFHLSFPYGSYYNNQYFMNPNERNIIGPFVPNDSNKFGFVLAQSFTRVNYGGSPPIVAP